MQFGIFTVGDVTTDPTTGRTPTEATGRRDVDRVPESLLDQTAHT